MEYIIEGTVSEVTVKNDKTVEFKIAGTEGYAIKQGDKKYNVLCQKGTVGKAYIFEQKEKYTTEKGNLSNLQTSISSGKKVRVEICNDVNSDSAPVLLNNSIISLLSD